MGYLHGVAHDILGVIRASRSWMSWNLILAILPAGLALLLFPHRDRRSAGWWIGVGVFALLLPNAPYVVTDLVHIRHDINQTTGHSVVIAGVLPLYATFILIGYLAYIASVELVVREVHTAWPTLQRWIVVGAIHATCSVGIVLGRVSRLNSWDTITHPRSTVERTFATLAWSRAPVFLAAIFVAVSVTYWVVRTLTVAAVRGIGEVRRRISGPRVGDETA